MTATSSSPPATSQPSSPRSTPGPIITPNSNTATIATQPNNQKQTTATSTPTTGQQQQQQQPLPSHNSPYQNPYPYQTPSYQSQQQQQPLPSRNSPYQNPYPYQTPSYQSQLQPPQQKQLINQQPPVANAGISQTVNGGTIVTLDGRISYDPDIYVGGYTNNYINKGIAGYQWTQIPTTSGVQIPVILQGASHSYADICGPYTAV